MKGGVGMGAATSGFTLGRGAKGDPGRRPGRGQQFPQGRGHRSQPHLPDVERVRGRGRAPQEATGQTQTHTPDIPFDPCGAQWVLVAVRPEEGPFTQGLGTL